MEAEGPLLESLTHRLAECPPDFLAEPRLPVGGSGTVNVAAVVGDLLRDLGGGTFPITAALPFENNAAGQRKRLRIVLIACWLLHDDWFRNRRHLIRPIYDLLAQGFAPLADLVEAPLFVSDAERREELARLCLSSLRLRPTGETPAQAQDRLTTLSSVERQRVILETRAAQERAAAIREAMRQKAAAEAAARYNRE